jgi:hypothetical protein
VKYFVNRGNSREEGIENRPRMLLYVYKESVEINAMFNMVSDFLSFIFLWLPPEKRHIQFIHRTPVRQGGGLAGWRKKDPAGRVLLVMV